MDGPIQNRITWEDIKLIMQDWEIVWKVPLNNQEIKLLDPEIEEVQNPNIGSSKKRKYL
jgi:hypothetical protein